MDGLWELADFRPPTRRSRAYYRHTEFSVKRIDRAFLCVCCTVFFETNYRNTSEIWWILVAAVVTCNTAVILYCSLLDSVYIIDTTRTKACRTLYCLRIKRHSTTYVGYTRRPMLGAITKLLEVGNLQITIHCSSRLPSRFSALWATQPFLLCNARR